MSRTPFMPLWVSDFLGDTLDLDAEDIGAYMLLLMAQWNRDGESLPNDDKKLQRIARCGRSWDAVWINIQRFFSTDENGVFSKRLRLEALNVAAKREVNARNGSRGGKAKALKTNNAGLANATHSPERNPSIPEPEPYKKEGTNVPLSAEPTRQDLAHVDEVAEAVADYNAAASQAGWPAIRILSKARRAALIARLREAGGIVGWRDALGKASASSHCCGRNDRGWVANFDFLTKQSSFAKLMEGNYDDRQSSGRDIRETAKSDALRDLINDAAGYRRSSQANFS